MLKFLLGLIILFGSVATIEYDVGANATLQTLLSFLGLSMMYYGAKELE